MTHGLDAVNTYSLLTCCSATLLFLPSFYAEGPAALAALRAAEDGGSRLSARLLLCGFCYFAYNECGFRVLDAFGPVSQAVANSAKRIVILFFAVYFLGESAAARSKCPKCPSYRQPTRPPTAPKARRLAQGCSLGRRGEPPTRGVPKRGCGDASVPAQRRRFRCLLTIQAPVHRSSSAPAWPLVA